MKSAFSIPLRFLSFLCLALVGNVGPSSGQPRPKLDLLFQGGQATLKLAGRAGAVYSIQVASGLSPTSHWTETTLLQACAAGTAWSDPWAGAMNRRFYRAVSVAAPTDTNLVFIEPGTFVMGSPPTETMRYADETQHGVTISRGFWIGKYLVTQKEYLSVVGNNPSYYQAAYGFANGSTRPVERISWFDATNYCALRTQKERATHLIATNYAYRLPTEAEWEYACRAGTTSPFYLGNSLKSGKANFDGRYQYDASLGIIFDQQGIDLGQTAGVGSYAANGWGLYDMIGNVFQWCSDWYGPYPTVKVIDPQGPATGTYRVFRAGSWVSQGPVCRSAQRNLNAPTLTSDYFGIRVVLATTQP